MKTFKFFQEGTVNTGRSSSRPWTATSLPIFTRLTLNKKKTWFTSLSLKPPLKSLRTAQSSTDPFTNPFISNSNKKSRTLSQVEPWSGVSRTSVKLQSSKPSLMIMDKAVNMMSLSSQSKKSKSDKWLRIQLGNRPFFKSSTPKLKELSGITWTLSNWDQESFSTQKPNLSIVSAFKLEEDSS